MSCFAWKAFLYTYTLVALTFTYISVTCAMYVCIDAVRCGSVEFTLYYNRFTSFFAIALWAIIIM